MHESMTDCVTIKVRRSGKKWQVEGIAVHGHSKMVTCSTNVRQDAPERSLLDPEVLGAAVRAVSQALGELAPVLPF